MKKILFLFMTLLLCTYASVGQQFSIEKSEEFDEPGYGWNKLLQLKNGNTLYLHSPKKEGMEITLYSKERKQIAQKRLVSKLWDVDNMKKTAVKGLYDINGEMVLFIVQENEHTPTLYRMRMNADNGAIVQEDELGHLPKIAGWEVYAESYGHMDIPDIKVEKDQETDNYAVIYFNTQAHDRSERIRVEHYDSKHKLLSNSFYESPNGDFKYLRYISCVVDGSKRVYVATYAHNGNSEDLAASRVIVSVLNAGDTSFKHKLLEFSDDFDDTKSVMLYNHGNNRIELLTVTYTHSKKKQLPNTNPYNTILTLIDPETLQPASVKPLPTSKIAAYAAKNIDKDYEFHGLPQNMIINKDNTITVLMEERKEVTENHTSNGHFYTSMYTQLGAIAIEELSDTGGELQGIAINKKQLADGIFPLLYLSQRSKGIFSQSGGDNQFLSYDYITAPHGHYVLFNDLPGNFDRNEDETKRKAATSISETNTICYKLNADKPDKFYLFGEPAEKRSATFSYIESSDYNKQTNTYATLIIEKNGKDKSAKIAWVKFE